MSNKAINFSMHQKIRELFPRIKIVENIILEMEERRKKSEQAENERHFMEQKLEIEKLSRPDINHDANLQASICLYCGHTKNVQNDKHSSYSEKSTTYSVEGQRINSSESFRTFNNYLQYYECPIISNANATSNC
ncbi:hypothetical protein NPIL_514211 [Nephila pilipes]|uniref:Uncharacterized protein n=1 Tax=Nephila pilipes TaxID=299642 RepID=A0A8X6QEN3_NEPPI|nr:hypothetical protein NPIL_164001 [Nephila pilipes]GFT95863.1 hypothetical protein NPIL_427891 [Nephila pilipes]GFU14460.1 hypothetical protein NPIL_217151 [Nephila pilipes]GFU16556.1 hypothetical protein NPIL_514211 [Nephila pilipes]